jgi:hypothetical protein
MGKPAIPWVRGNRETWILELIAEYQRHFQETGNRYFVLAAYEAATYLTDRAAHKLVLSWVDVGLGLIVRRLLAGVDNPLRDSPPSAASVHCTNKRKSNCGMARSLSKC